MPGPLDPAVGKTPLPAAMLVLLLVCAGLCWRTMAAGLAGLVKGPTADTCPRWRPRPRPCSAWSF